ncbi:pilus assembly protein [Stenotrophomonas sp.]|uniref:pilus assembly protein n=1 Tax=Stenotrophomonas sp. TaxID=69392 RepID=UPI0028B087C2|nr:pilus assembly protein [Stenotrophomonas sp.]
MKKFVATLLPLVLLAAPPAYANLTVHPMRTSVEGKRSAQIRVYSQSTQAQYVQASLRRIDNPASAEEREVEIEPNEAAITITPGKFALSGGGNRLIRLIPLQLVDKETAYRVYFEGVRGPEETERDGDGTSRANVGVSLVWGALVNVLPANGEVSLRLQGNTLHNTGTLRVGITSIAECSSAGACTAHDVSHSLYPDAGLELPFQPKPGSTLQLRYRLTRDGYREHVQTVAASAG